MTFRQKVYLSLIKISGIRLIFTKVEYSTPERPKLSSLNFRYYSNHPRQLQLLCNSSRKMKSITANEQRSRLSYDKQPSDPIYSAHDKSRSSEHPVIEGSALDKDYKRCLNDLNSLIQLITPLTKRERVEILPLFRKQLKLAGIGVSDLNKLNIIHVSGTKGKGSTCAFVESILRHAGFKTGFYSSPHLVKVNERIRIDGKVIDDESFSRYFRHIYDRLHSETKVANIPMPGYFSFLTILAFHIFLDQRVDAAVVEVGVGGEYDPTNVVERPIVCGISTLDYDHTSILGKRLSEIAWSKAGIAKEGVPLFTVRQQAEAYEVIKQRCDGKICPIYTCEPLHYSYETKLGIKGSAQCINAALACQLAKYFLETTSPKFKSVADYSEETHNDVTTDLSSLPSVFRSAISSCTWPGRCQIVKYPKISFFLDGAHTKKSMENCLEWFRTSSYGGHSGAVEILMINIIGDRDRQPILLPLSKYKSFKTILFSTNKVSSDNDNQLSNVMDNVQNNVKVWKGLVGDCEDETNVRMMSSTSACLEFLIEMSRNNPEANYNILATGSLHFVGAVLETLPAFQNDLNES